MTAATDRIATLLRRAPVFDGHNDVAWALRRLVAGRPETALDGVDLGAAQPALHTDVPRLRAGGVGPSSSPSTFPAPWSAGRR